jgi:predicted PurR-regulated permease PerM
MYQAITGYVTGNILISIIAGSTAALTLWLVGAPYPVPLAFLYGVLDLLPLVGATIGGILLVTVALFNSVTSAVIVLAYVIIYQQIENSLLQPLIYGRAIRLEAFVVLVAVIIGAALGGVVGALLAIPIAACAEVAIKFYLGALEA